MATAAPTVTIAVEIHSTPTSSQIGRGLWLACGGGSDQDFERRLRLAQRHGRTFDRGNVAGKLIAFDGRRRAGITGICVVTTGPRRRAHALICQGRGVGRAIRRENAEIMIGHDAHLPAPAIP